MMSEQHAGEATGLQRYTYWKPGALAQLHAAVPGTNRAMLRREGQRHNSSRRRPTGSTLAASRQRTPARRQSRDHPQTHHSQFRGNRILASGGLQLMLEFVRFHLFRSRRSCEVHYQRCLQQLIRLWRDLQGHPGQGSTRLPSLPEQDSRKD